MISNFYLTEGIAIVSLIYTIMIMLIFLLKGKRKSEKYYSLLMKPAILSIGMNIIEGPTVVEKLKIPSIIGLTISSNKINKYTELLSCSIEFRDLNKIINNLFKKDDMKGE